MFYNPALQMNDKHTFESYCKERWGMTKSRANQLVGAARTIENLATIVAKPATESVVRPLTKLRKIDGTPDEAWQEAGFLPRLLTDPEHPEHPPHAKQEPPGCDAGMRV